MKILITGVHGFVGSNLVKCLASANEIYGLDIIAPEKEGVVKTYSWDDLDKGTIPEIDAIIHLAGKAHDTKNQSAADVYFKVNTGLTQKIFDWYLAHPTAKKFIQFSTVKSAADRVEGDFLTEECIPSPVGPYGESKIAAENYILFEGIGLRQIIDYYFVLKAEVIFDKDRIVKTLKDLRLTKFAEAMMWILNTQLGLDEGYLICGMNEREGRFVLSEIMQTGNFGKSDSRYKYSCWFKLRCHIAHGSHLLMHYPSEVIWTPIWLLYHKIWKWDKKRKIRKNWK